MTQPLSDRELEELLRELYDYVVMLEGASGALLLTHGGKFPDSGKELGVRVRAALEEALER